MTQIGTARRLATRIRWLGTPDPSWTAEDGRPTTEWAVEQALAFVEAIERAGVLDHAEPQVTATARGGIEFVWESPSGDEIDITVPAGPEEPIEIARMRRGAGGSLDEDEQAAWTVADAVALVAGHGS